MFELKKTTGMFSESMGLRLTREMVQDLEALRSEAQAAAPQTRVSRADILRTLILEKSATPTLAALGEPIHVGD